MRVRPVTIVLAGLAGAGVAFGLSVLGGSGGEANGLDLSSVGMGVTVSSVILVIGWSLSGNVKLRRMSGAERLAALAAEPPAGMGAIVIIRQGWPGKFVGMDLSLDGRRVAQLKSPSCVRVLAPAGRRQLSGYMMQAYKSGPGAPQAMAVDVTAGETVFLLARFVTGWKGGLILEQAPDGTAARRLAERTPMVRALV